MSICESFGSAPGERFRCYLNRRLGHFPQRWSRRALTSISTRHGHPGSKLGWLKAVFSVISLSTKNARWTERARIGFLDPVTLFSPERLHFSFRVRRSKKGWLRSHSRESDRALQR